MIRHAALLQRFTVAAALAATAGTATAGDAAKQPPIAAATAARLPENGRLIAFATSDEELVIVRLGRNGAVELLRDKSGPVRDVHWLDARTLVVMGVDPDSNAVFRRVVDGAVDLARTVTVKPGDWALKKGQAFPDVPLLTPSIGPDGGLWLEVCVQLDEEALGDACKKAAWLRADASPRKTVFKRPKGLKGFGTATSLKTLPKVAAPAGYQAKVVKLKKGHAKRGVECTGPKGKTVWSGDTFEETGAVFETDKLQWVSATPPLLVAEGMVSTPGGDWRDLRAFEACGAAPIESFAWLGDGIWAKSAGEAPWTFLLDDQPIGVVKADGWPRPAPR